MRRSEPWRQLATDDEVAAALRALDTEAFRLAARDWSGSLAGLNVPGLYSWWVDDVGVALLVAGLGENVVRGRIYAGLTGATKWPSGKTVGATLGSRIGGNHLGGTIRGSTFRRTLAAGLRRSLGLELVGPGKLSRDSELQLANWMRAHLELAVHPFAEADALNNLESRVLQALDPPLNLDGMPPSILRIALGLRRDALTAGIVGS